MCGPMPSLAVALAESTAKVENGVDQAYDFGTHMAEEGITPHHNCSISTCSTKLVWDYQGLQDSLNVLIMKKYMFFLQNFQPPQLGFTLGATTMKMTTSFFPTQSGLEIATHLKSEFQTYRTFFSETIRGSMQNTPRPLTL